MANTELTDFSLPKNAYATFDAVSLKALIKDRLSNNTSFTDHNYEGSNMSALMDIIAYSYHVLLFYLNQTATESMFSEAELYENMNRIVKSLDYKPVGYQTSVLSFEATGDSSLAPNTYTIPRYTYFSIGNMKYSFSRDITFTKTTTESELLTEFSNKNLLYQGEFREYPVIEGIGEEFETVILLPGDDIIIDHFNIDVYVKDATTLKWEQWSRTTSLFLENSTSRSFEVRLNENKHYEIKFGNNSTGKRINPGDQIAVYYLASDGIAGQVGIGAINSYKASKHTTVRFTEIFDTVKDPNIKYISQSELTFLSFANSNASSEYYEGETVSDIRERAPKVFATQYRLVTKEDHENYIKQTYSNIVRDVKVVNNWDYLDGHFKYNIETLRLASNNEEPRTLLNQAHFADACDFNNLYCYAVPRLERTSSGIIRTNYLTPSQKNSIISGLRNNKILTTEIVIMDPVYMAVDVGAHDGTKEALTQSIKDHSEIIIMRDTASTRSFESIQNASYNIILNYFKAFKLGQTISISEIVNNILNLDGVSRITTSRIDGSLSLEGLNLLVWNPVYPETDIVTIGSDLTMPIYKYPYLNDPTGLINKIKVKSETAITGSAEF